MKKSKIVIVILIIISIVVVAFCFNSNKSIELKENQIKIGNIITTVTSKEDFNKYENDHDISFYNNNNSIDIEIRDANILTYKNIKVGDSINKLDFCNKSVGMIYYFESQYRSHGYHLEIQYGTDNKEIITITYHFY